MSPDEGAKARYIMIGGFLGAGKTTAVAKLAEYVTARNQRVGLITNDQGSGLVDTTMLRSQGFNVAEIPGGCFCCRFNSLLEAANRLTEESKPDAFIAEPVGSCTDLIATVSYPLRRIYGDQFTIAPLSVLVDPVRAARVLGIEKGRSFSPKVVYVYRKQLEEADVIVINKCDIIDAKLRGELQRELGEQFPRADVLCVSAKEGEGLDAWFQRVLSDEQDHRPTMDVDYETYAEGEALLGWLNCTVQLKGKEPFDGNALLVEMVERICERLREESSEIAHLKMTLDPTDEGGSLAAVSLVRNDAEPDLRESLLDRVSGGELIINLRGEADPEALHRITMEALEESAATAGGVEVTVEHVERFRPGKPDPTHRMRIPE